MSNKKQSSIEWLIQKQKDIEKGVFDGFSHLSISSMYEQAKQLHKQEIIEAYEQGAENEFTKGGVSCSDYYNDTYRN